ncbi:ATP-binding protein [Streptomyces sp. NPDC005202]|uniref:ATP-binding protein n=1 Tax=Streptomyces sp. NPDC005202 TaxID=3157021 RepID=UPI0033BF87B7
MRHLAQHAFSSPPKTVRTARAFAMQALDSWGGCRRRDDIRACVSELAGNAILHASPDGRTYLVRIIRHSHCRHVEVHDSARQSSVRMPPPSLPGETGRGMHIVQELSDDWGVQTAAGDGKAVWACFRRPEALVSRCSCEH